MESQRHNMTLHANAAMAALKLKCYIAAQEHCDKVGEGGSLVDINASGCHNTSAHASSGDAFLWRLPRMRIPAKIKAVAVAVCHVTFFVRMGRRLVWCLHHCCVVSLQVLHLAEVLHNTPQHPLCVKALQRRAAAHQVRPPTELMMRACKSCSAACISCRSAHCCAHAHPLRNHSMINTSLKTMHTCTHPVVAVTMC